MSPGSCGIMLQVENARNLATCPPWHQATVLTYIALAVLIYACGAGFFLARKARSVLEWRLSYRWALLGQLAVSAAALATASAFVLAAFWSGLLQGEALAVFGVASFLLAWQLGLGPLIGWLADRAPDSKLVPFRLRRLKWDTAFAMLLTSALAAAAAFLVLELVITPESGAGDRAPGQVPQAVGIPTPGGAREDASSVLGAVRAWAEAWSNRDVTRYLASYAPDFRTPKAESRGDWEAGRRLRIGNTSRIAIGIESPEVTFTDAATATVRFRQRYESNLMSETSRKTLVMGYADGRWRILEERRSGK